MSVTGIGASIYPPTQSSWSGQPGRWVASKPGSQNSDIGASTAATDSTDNGATTNFATGGTSNGNSGAATNGTSGVGNGATIGAAIVSNTVSNYGTITAANNTANGADNGANPLPPVQAATAPGTGLKIDVIA